MSSTPFDFRQPPPSHLENKTTSWLREACVMAQRIWAKLLPFKTELIVERINAMSAVKSFDKLADNFIAFRLKVEQFPEVEPLLMLSRPVLLALINGSLGVTPEQLPEDRELSTVESSICAFLIDQLFLKVFTEAWPAANHPKFICTTRGEPKGVSTLPPNDLVLVCQMQLTAPFGVHQIMLVMPRSAPLTELVKPSVDPVPVREVANELLEAIVRDMPIDLSVELGNTELTMLQVATLRAGDVVVLSQKVNEPLRATVAGKDKFAVWPGAVGRRQAVQVEQLIDQQGQS